MSYSGFPGGSAEKDLPANAEDTLDPWIGKTPCRRKQQPTPIFLPRNPTDKGVWWAMLHGSLKCVGHDLVIKQQQTVIFSW